MKVDLHYFCYYWNKNPYRICRKYFQKKENKEVLYGDTWPMSAYQFVKSLPIRSEDIVYDVGCGIGRISFWLQIISGCSLIGVEKVPAFVQRAQKIKRKLKNKKIEFVEKDLLNLDYRKASLIYFYSSSFSDETILKLIEKWKRLKKGVRILTTSFSLSEYGAKDYKIVKSYRVSFPWGLCEVYLHEKI